MDKKQIKNIVEAALFAAGQPLNLKRLMALFPENVQPGRDDIRAALDAITKDCESRGIELKEVKSGFRFQVRQDYAEWVGKLWEERPARYSRASLETLALIAYRQPITRAEIEQVRGVSVSSQIIRTLQERNWIQVVGHRDVPGRPALYATTREFLDYFNLKSLEELPSLAEIRDIDAIEGELNLELPGFNVPDDKNNQSSQDINTQDGNPIDDELSSLIDVDDSVVDLQAEEPLSVESS